MKSKINYFNFKFVNFAVLFVGVSFLLLIPGCAKKSAPQMQGPEVSVIQMHYETVAITTELPGRTAAFRIAEIRPQVSGLIQKRLFTEGTEIKTGDMLYQIDPAPFKAAFDKVNANLSALKLRAERYKEALIDKAVSQQEFDDADAALKQVQAELETARINLEYTRVISPINGRIGTSNVTEGAIVTAYQSMPLATIQQLDPIYVDIPQSTTELLRLRRNLDKGSLNSDKTSHNKVKLILEDGTFYPLDGALQFQDITVEPTTGSVILRVIFPNPNGILLPGMFVRAVITEGVDDHAILIPQQGVSRNPKGEAYALIVNNENNVEQRILVLDRAIGDKWLVSSGLNPDDKVIVEGIQKVRPGTPVKTVLFKTDKN